MVRGLERCCARAGCARSAISHLPQDVACVMEYGVLLLIRVRRAKERMHNNGEEVPARPDRPVKQQQ